MLAFASKLQDNTTVREDGCWMFTGSWDGFGYGEMRCDGVRMRAHVASYKIHKGTIPEGMYVCHECDNPWCVNPEHLFLGTLSDNIKDMWAKGRGVLQDTKGELNGCAKLNSDDVLEIRKLADEGYSLADLGHLFNVHLSTAWKIVHRKTWRHI